MVLYRGDLVYADCARMVSEACWVITGCLPSGVDMGRLLEGPGCKEAHFIDPLAKQVLLWFWRTSTPTAFRDVFHVHRRLRSIHGSSLVFMFMLVDGSPQE